jgi:hypothetical protein
MGSGKIPLGSWIRQLDCMSDCDRFRGTHGMRAGSLFIRVMIIGMFDAETPEEKLLMYGGIGKSLG